MSENTVAERLRDRIPAIMHEWEGRVRKEVPAAAKLDQFVLYNSLASMLEVMAKVLEDRTDPRTAARDLAYLTVHGGERAEQVGYSLGDVILECQTLQEVVLRALEPHALLTEHYRTIVIVYFNEMVRVIAAEYARVQQQRIQDYADQLARSNRAKDEFLAMLSHELRNPLGAVSNSLYLLQASRGQLAGSALDIAVRQVGHMSKMVDDLLDLARVNEGKVILRTEVLDLGSAVEEAVAAARGLLNARQHTVSVPVPEKRLYVRADPVRLAQCLANLLANAAKYTQPGGRITIAVEPRGNEAIVRIQDDGVGIPAHLLPHIFDLFQQASQHLDRAQGGLGIGLTVVRRVVEMHGGRIEAFSDGLGRGSAFVLSLPRLDAVSETPTVVPRTPAPAGLRILLVEDNKDAAETLSQLLGLWGHDVVVTQDGRTALDAVNTFRAEVALVDIGLPGMSGLELAQILRSREGGSFLTLLALTGYADDREAIISAGFDAHLLKPLDVARLQEELSKVRRRL